MVDLLVVLLVMYIGLFASMILPYGRKRKQGKIEQFDIKFLYHTAVAALWEFVAGFTLYLAWTPSPSILSEIGILVIAFAFGYGGLEGQKQAEKIVRLFLVRSQPN